MRAFSLSAQFARESAMLKLPEERRRCIFSSPPPPPFPSFALAPTVRVTISTLPNQFHRRKIKDSGYNNITNTNKVSPTKNTPALQAIYFRMIILLILITWISEFKLPGNGSNIYCWMLQVAAVCTPYCMLFRIVGICCAEYEVVKLLSQQLPTFLLFSDRWSIAQQCWIRLHSSSNIVRVA